MSSTDSKQEFTDESGTSVNTTDNQGNNNTKSVSISGMNISVENSTKLPENISQVIKLNTKGKVKKMTFCESPHLYHLKLIVCKKQDDKDGSRGVEGKRGSNKTNEGDDEEINIDT